LNWAGWHAGHLRTGGKIVHHGGTGANHRARANLHTWPDYRARTNQRASPNPDTAGQHRAGADMRGFCHHAIMFHNCAGIDQRKRADLSLRPDHGAGEDGGTLTHNGAMADQGGGVDQAGQAKASGAKATRGSKALGIIADGWVGKADPLPGQRRQAAFINQHRQAQDLGGLRRGIQKPCCLEPAIRQQQISNCFAVPPRAYQKDARAHHGAALGRGKAAARGGKASPPGAGLG